MDFEKISIFNNDELLCELVGIKDILKYEPEQELLDLIKYKPEKDIQIIAFETSSGIDFVKIIAERTMLGIRAETMYANYIYPEFEKGMQKLISLKINGNAFPFDLINYVNKKTGEEKNIYFDISSFYGTEL